MHSPLEELASIAFRYTMRIEDLSIVTLCTVHFIAFEGILEFGRSPLLLMAIIRFWELAISYRIYPIFLEQKSVPWPSWLRRGANTLSYAKIGGSIPPGTILFLKFFLRLITELEFLHE